MREAVLKRLSEKYANATLSTISGGIEYFGSVVKVFYNPTIQEY